MSMTLSELSTKWLSQGVTNKEIMKSICPVPYKEQGKEGLAIAIKELNDCLSLYGLAQPEDAKIYIKMIEMTLIKNSIGKGQITEAFEVLVNHKISNSDLDFNRFGRPIDLPFLNTLIKRYVVYKKKEKHKQIRDHINSTKKFVEAPNDGSLEKIEKLAREKNLKFLDKKKSRNASETRKRFMKLLGKEQLTQTK